MKELRESGENYLEVILDIEREKGVVRSVEVAKRVGVSRASVSKAITVLRSSGLIEPAYYGDIVLTAEGRKRAQAVRERHDLLCHFLRDGLGVASEVAERDACRIEHVVSQELLTHVAHWMADQHIPPLKTVHDCNSCNGIRLVAADMDGTLLNQKKQYSPKLPEVVKQLKKRDIRFVIASGRQYYNLLDTFPNLQDDLLYIAENGGMVCDGKQILDSYAIPTEQLQEPIALVQQIPNAHLILCGAQSAYTDCADDPIFLQHAKMYYAKLSIVPDFMEAAKQDSICKMAVFLYKQAENILYPALCKGKDAFVKVLSGDCWVDLMPQGLHKGRAMRFLQQYFGLKQEECMAFGDYPNDCEMMDAVYHSYAMANAHPQLAAHCRFRAPSNEEDGVIRTLVEKFDLSVDK